MIEYTMQVSWTVDGKLKYGYIDVQAENSYDARLLAKTAIENRHPGADVYLHHGVSNASSSPYIWKEKHIK